MGELIYMVGEKWRAVGMTAAAALLASCATIISGTEQEIAVDSDPPGAQCTFARGTEGVIGRIDSTPGKLTVQRRKEVLQVTCIRDGYEPTTEILQAKFSGATMANFLLGGLIGAVIDADSGANNDYPERLMVVMTPATFADFASRDEHFAKVADRIRLSAANEITAIQDKCSSNQRELCRIDTKRIEEARDRALAKIEQKRAAAKVAQVGSR